MPFKPPSTSQASPVHARTARAAVFIMFNVAILVSGSAGQPMNHQSETQADNVTLFVSPTGSDVPPGDGSLAHPFQTLARALEMGGNTRDVTLRLLPGRYASAGDRGLAPRVHVEPSSLQLVGDSSGGEPPLVDLTAFGSPFLELTQGQAKVSVSDLTIANGWGQSALKISSSHISASFVRVGFRNNGKVTSDERTMGAAVHVARGSMESGISFSECTFTTNKAGIAGAMYLGSPASIERCIFEENLAFGKTPQPNNGDKGAGGGVVVDRLVRGEVWFSDCVFRNNMAASGGALYSTPAPTTQGVYLNNCSFQNNSALVLGGAIDLSSPARVENCTFLDNSVGQSHPEPLVGGGAVHIGNRIAGEVSISNCTFRRNAASGGGAVLVQLGINITGCVFENNQAVSSGGAIEVASGIFGQGPQISDSTFHGNSALGGGALFVQSPGQVHGCTFVGNLVGASGHGGSGIYVSSGVCGEEVLISNCSFRENNAQGPGTVYVGSPVGRVDGCIFEDNIAFDGGAVFLAEMDSELRSVFISNCEMRNNSVSREGGGMSVLAAVLVEDCIFESNSALSGSGGALLVSHKIRGTVKIRFCTFQRNRARGFGGGLNLGSVASVTSCLFENNTVLDENGAHGGGGVFVGALGKQSTLVSNCSFLNNSAPMTGLGGAALFESPAVVQGCTFKTNTAQFGGAVTAAAPGIALSGCVFSNNVALGGGRAVWVTHGLVSLQSCAVCDLTAASSIECNGTGHEGVQKADISSTVPVDQIISRACRVPQHPDVGASFSLVGASPSLFGAVCGHGQVTHLYTTRNESTPSSQLATMEVTIRSKVGTSIVVTKPMPNSSAPELLVGPRAFAGLMPSIVTAPSGQAQQTVLNVAKGKCLAGCFPDFGVQVRSPLSSDPHEAIPFLLEAHEEGPQLSLERSEVDVLGFPFAWVGLNTLLLVRLRDGLGQPVPKQVQIHLDGKTALCGQGQDTGRKGLAIHLCSVKFGHEGTFTLDLYTAEGEKIGALHDKVTVVSLGWPIALGVMLFIAVLGTSGWMLVRAWRRRRQRATDRILANYVGLGQHSDGANALRTSLKHGELMIDKSFLIPFSAIDIRRDIAAGAAGKVSLGTWKGTSVAVKRLYTAMFDVNDEEKREGRALFIKELALHKELRHPNVVQLLGVCIDPLCIVLEFMERGSLYGCLQERETVDMPWALRLRCSMDVARAMAYLHEEGVLHRDLKSLNVLVNDGWRCKVADFDQSKAGAGTLTATVGTDMWCAPEVLEGHGEYGKAADVYSFGIVMFECWTREGPFQGRGTPFSGPAAPSRAAVYTHIVGGGRPVCPETQGEPPEPYRDCMVRCWDANPAKRPAFNDLVDTLERTEVELISAVQEDVEGSRRGSVVSGSGSISSSVSGSWSSLSSRAWRGLRHLGRNQKAEVERDHTSLDTPLLPV